MRVLRCSHIDVSCRAKTEVVSEFMPADPGEMRSDVEQRDDFDM